LIFIVNVVDLPPLSDVLPLVYNALESEHAAVRRLLSSLQVILICLKVQERALGVVPGLCESIDYAEVRGVLFPRVAVRRAMLSHECAH
jgi:SCY1-like protein 2